MSLPKKQRVSFKKLYFKQALFKAGRDNGKRFSLAQRFLIFLMLRTPLKLLLCSRTPYKIKFVSTGSINFGMP